MTDIFTAQETLQPLIRETRDCSQDYLVAFNLQNNKDKVSVFIK